MRESAVRLGHSVRVFTALDRCTRVVEGIQKLVSQLLLHRFARTPSRRGQEPAHGKRLTPGAFDLHRDLVCRAAHATRLDLDHGRRVPQRLLEHFERSPAGPLRDPVQRAVDDALGRALFAALHHLVDEPRQNLALIACVRCRNPALDLCPTWHIRSLDRSRRRGPLIASVRRRATCTPYTRKSGERLKTSGRFSHRVQSDPLRRMVPSGVAVTSKSPRALCPYFGALVPYFDRACLRLSTPRASRVPRTMW